MTSVKQLMAKFSNTKPGSNGGGPLTPVSFEEQKKQARQKELDEIRQAKEKAKLYNATLRAKSIQMAKEQSSRTRSHPTSPKNLSGMSGLGGSMRSFNFEAANNPNFQNPDEAQGALAQHQPQEEDEEKKTSSGPLPQRLEESFEGKNEEKKDILTEMACPPRNSMLELKRLSSKQKVPMAIEPVLPTDQIANNRHSLKNSPMHVQQQHISLKSAPSMTDITDAIPPMSLTLGSSPPAGTRVSASGSLVVLDTAVRTISFAESEGDELERTTSMLSMQGIPEGGYEEIHEAVRFNRPSVSDLLLKPTLGERNYSVTSVGPMVDVPGEEPSRLLPGVDIRTVLHTFYQTYAPEKLDDLDLVLRHFKGRTEALLFTLECKYFVNISPDGLVTPYRPSEAPPEAETIEDERMAARRGTMMSTATDMTDFTTDSYKGYIPSDSRDGGLPSTLANSWAVRPKHDSGRRGDGRKTAVMMKKAGSDLL